MRREKSNTKPLKRAIALLLALGMALTLSACAGSETAATAENKPAEQPVSEARPSLTVAYSQFSGKFSPFYAGNSYDLDVVNLVGLHLMTLDRMSCAIRHGIEGESVNYNGTDYLYTGPADLSAEYDTVADQTIYAAKLRKDLKFSDGVSVTAKDILFTYYTYLDPAYGSASMLSSYDIVGLEAWRTGAANSIEGIKMLDDYTVSVTVNGAYSTLAFYSILGITITPMHYYGDVNKWDPDNGLYGFERGDLSRIQTLSAPLGAGPYVFESYKDHVVTFQANPYYYKGEPKIKTVRFKEIASAEVAAAVKTGEVDCGQMTGSRTLFEEVAACNSNGEINGDVITTSKVDNPGYGYIGINADTVNVGGEPGSDASKALRKGLATILAVYRDVACDAYYGEAASVIQYPISNTSWAAPQPSDPGYRIAFSVDANGNDIYNANMSAEEKYAAAKAAALTWFQAAGYTVEGGKVTAAPEGGKTVFEVIIPGDGSGDHPCYMTLTMARDAFEAIGITLEIHDPDDSNDLWNALDYGTQELWCAAWGSTIDPDLYQVYHSNNIVGKGGTNSNHYHLTDPALDQLIMDARISDDLSFRKAAYKECLNIILDWAVEIPAYQRQNCVIFSTQRINIDTLTPDITTYWGWMNDIEKLEMR